MRIRICVAILLAAFCCGKIEAQADVPILSGGAGFLSSTSSGNTILEPTIAPVFTAPIGNRWLVEARGYFVEVIFRQNGSYTGQFFHTFEYGQVDFLATRHLTISAGRFLTPFGIYNERLTPIWIHKFQDGPIIFPIGTTGGYGNGGMLRGSLVSRDSYEISYVAYFSTLVKQVDTSSQRTAGGRLSVFLPNQRLEIGTSYGRRLQNQEMNFEDVFASWQPHVAPLDVKTEYAHSPRGQGYWLEGGYRLTRGDGPYTGLGRVEAIARIQQFQRLQTGSGDDLPGVNANRVDVGGTYRFPHEVRLMASYGRQTNASTARNIWEVGITYRFLFPLYPGASH